MSEPEPMNTEEHSDRQFRYEECKHLTDVHGDDVEKADKEDDIVQMPGQCDDCDAVDSEFDDGDDEGAK
jgi:hypothetical protein